MPTGVYVVKGDQVRWVPAVDTTIVVLASLGLVRLLARAWTRRGRARRDRSARLRALIGPWGQRVVWVVPPLPRAGPAVSP